MPGETHLYFYLRASRLFSWIVTTLLKWRIDWT